MSSEQAGSGGKTLRGHLQAIEDQLADAVCLVSLVRPNPAAEHLRRNVRAARDALEAALELVTTDGPTAPSAASDEETDHMERRDLLKLGSVLGVAAMAPLELLERVTQGAGRRTPVDGVLLDDLASLTTIYASKYDQVSPTSLSQPVAAHMNRVTRLLDGSLSPAARRKASGLAGEVAAFAGWLAFLKDQRGAARAHFALARDAAHEAEDDALKASVLGSMSYLCSRTHSPTGHGDTVTALALIDQANATIPDEAPASLRSWLAARQGVEHAADGDEDGYFRSMDRAKTILRDHAGETTPQGFFSDGGRFATWDEALLRGFEGTGLVLLGRAAEAQTVLWESLAETPYSKRRSTTLADLAAAYAQQSEVAQACRAAKDSLAIATEIGFSLGIQRLHGVRARMHRWDSDPAVRDLDVELAKAAA